MTKNNSKLKVITILIAFSLLCVNTFGQQVLKEGTWEIGEVKDIDGVKIKRLEGVNSNKEITNVSYMSQKGLLNELKLDKKRGRIGGDKYKKKIKEYKEFAKGGVIQLYLERGTQTEGNTQHFTIEATKGDGGSIVKKELKDKSAKHVTKTGVWKNQGFSWINTDVERPFKISVYENNGDIVRIYVFEVLE